MPSKEMFPRAKATMASLNQYRRTFSELPGQPYSHRNPLAPRSGRIHESSPHLSETGPYPLRLSLNPLTIPFNNPYLSHLDGVTVRSDSTRGSTTPSSSLLELQGSESPSFHEQINSSFSNSPATSDWGTHNMPFLRTEATPKMLPDYAREESSPCSAASDRILDGKKFYCPYCIEVGRYVGIKTKHDWKRHIHNFHEGGSVNWQCACSKIFESDGDLRDHFKHQHGGVRQVSMRDARITRKSPPKRIFACGYTDCIKVYDSFKKWCNHVAEEMKERPPAKWNYTWRINNILRHEDIADAWFRLQTYRCTQLGISLAELEWKPRITQHVREQLECLTFKSHEEPPKALWSLLEELFELGLPSYHTSPNPGTLLSQSNIFDTSVVDPQLECSVDSELSYNNAPFSAFAGPQFQEVREMTLDLTSPVPHTPFNHFLGNITAEELVRSPETEGVPLNSSACLPTWQDYLGEPPVPSAAQLTPTLHSPVPQRRPHKLSLSPTFNI